MFAAGCRARKHSGKPPRRARGCCRGSHGVAAGFRAVAEQRAELAQAGVERLAVQLDQDVAGEQFVVGNFHARAEVCLVAEDRVADVIEVCRVGTIEQQRVFQFGRIADDAAVADDDVFADVGVVADLAALADDGRPLIIAPSSMTVPSPMKTLSPINALPSSRIADYAGRFQIGGDVALNFFERVQVNLQPSKMAACSVWLRSNKSAGLNMTAG